MNLETVKELLQMFDESGVTRMRLACEGLEMELEKGQAAVYSAPMAPVAEPQAVVQAPAVVEAAQPSISGTEVTSPIVGIFYPASSPEAEPYVRVGQTVKKGDTLCIIEAMKVMNEVPSPCNGVVTAVCVEREQLVEYGQVLMVIEER